MTRFGLAFAATCALVWQPALAADPIGTAEEVVNEALQTPPGAQRGPLKLKDSVYSNAVIETEPFSGARLVFVDQTDLRIESESKITLDSYVYNPNTQTTDAVLTFAGGAFRFISGVAKENVEIRAPIGTIGIRGTDFWCEWYPPAPLRCEVYEGAIEISPGGTGNPVIILAGQIGTLFSAAGEVFVSQLAFLEPGGPGRRRGQPSFVHFAAPPLDNPRQNFLSNQ